MTVVDTEQTFDLVLIQSAEVLLGDRTVAVGNYTQIRLDVTNVDVTLAGEVVSAELPSGKLKVVRNWEVNEGETTVLTLDFEADRFVVVTSSGRVQVKPVLKLEVTKGDRPLKTAGGDDADADDDAADADANSVDDEDHDAGADAGAEPLPLAISSTAFTEGEVIPAQYTYDGANMSPALS